MEKIHAIAFSPHPDDAEMGCGGTLASLAAQGYRVAIVDLSRGERASRGSAETRLAEAATAATILGLAHRENLALPDSGLFANDGSARLAVVRCLRRLSPELVFVPLDDGRHPDHREASQLVSDALFLAGLQKFETPDKLPPSAPMHAIGYATRNHFDPQFVVDISSHYKQKLASIEAYASQLSRVGHLEGAANTVRTLIGSPLTLGAVEARDTVWGAMIGVARGEGFKMRSPLRIDNPLSHVRACPSNSALLFPG